MTKISPILEKLENTNSQKEKIEILKTMNEIQKRWFSLCYNSLILDYIPADDFDRGVDYIITEKQAEIYFTNLFKKYSA